MPTPAAAKAVARIAVLAWFAMLCIAPVLVETRKRASRFRSQLLTWANGAESAINAENLAGDPGVFRIEEPGNGRGDILGLPDAA